MIKVIITGAAGLIGWHSWARLHAANCAATFQGHSVPYDIAALDHAGFEDDTKLLAALKGAQCVLHFAGVNRADSDNIIEAANPAIAQRLVDFCARSGVTPTLVYANSTHAATDTPYGRSKRVAYEILSAYSQTHNLIMPHIFGECARPFYNNVTATLIDQIIQGIEPSINPNGQVHLLHAGEAAALAIAAGITGTAETLTPAGRQMSVPALYEKLFTYHTNYGVNILPDLRDPFDLALFNSYRAATFPNGWPRPLTLHTDERGTLFEVVKGGGGGQSFMSSTLPGVTRGDHFHLNKVERFLVVQGEALIHIRRVGSDVVTSYRVNGDTPMPVDMPTLHTHSIENVGDVPLVTLFWTHEIFDPQNPDTFADKVQQ